MDLDAYYARLAFHTDKMSGVEITESTVTGLRAVLKPELSKLHGDDYTTPKIEISVTWSPDCGAYLSFTNLDKRFSESGVISMDYTTTSKFAFWLSGIDSSETSNCIKDSAGFERYRWWEETHLLAISVFFPDEREPITLYMDEYILHTREMLEFFAGCLSRMNQLNTELSLPSYLLLEHYCDK